MCFDCLRTRVVFSSHSSASTSQAVTPLFARTHRLHPSVATRGVAAPGESGSLRRGTAWSPWAGFCAAPAPGPFTRDNNGPVTRDNATAPRRGSRNGTGAERSAKRRRRHGRRLLHERTEQAREGVNAAAPPPASSFFPSPPPLPFLPRLRAACTPIFCGSSAA